MSQIKELLTKQLRDLLDAEKQLTQALPKMARAAHHPKLKEAFQKHLGQTEGQVERLRTALSILEMDVEPQTCEAMTGLIREGEKAIKEGTDEEPLAADLALIAAAQKVEHYEIASYGTARTLARQLGSLECAKLLSETLGEEEATDFLLTTIADPLIQQLSLDDAGASVQLGRGEPVAARRGKSGQRSRDAA